MFFRLNGVVDRAHTDDCEVRHTHLVAPWRSRLYVGHQGEVTSLAPSADRRLLVSAARDQTVSGWNLEGWPSHPELGARFTVRGNTEGVPDDFAAMEEILTRRLVQWESQQDLSPHDPKRNESFATLPNLIVIDGGPGQLAAGLRALEGFRARGVAIVSLAKRLEEVFTPGSPRPIVLAHDTPELQLLQRVRDEAHRFAITHHRSRRDRAMKTSLLDDLPAIGPARKRALLNHFGSPEAVVAASREELEAVTGIPAKVARDVHAHLHRI